MNGGSYALLVDNEETVPIPFDATASEIQAILESLSFVNPGDVSVEGDLLSGRIEVLWQGRLADNLPQTVIPNTSNLEGVAGAVPRNP